MDALRRLRAEGFAFVPAMTARAAIAACGPLDDWPTFAATWDDLPLDPYRTAADRRRRHGRFVVARDGAAVQAPDAPHVQAPAYNSLYGGIERHLAPLSTVAGEARALRTLLAYGATGAASLAPTAARWDVEVHQFRIEARAGAPGQPTPEGVHRDGVDFVLVVLVSRVNLVEGTTTIHGPDGRELGAFTLAAPFDVALVDDHRVHHGVTPAVAVDADAPACRDVLVVTYRAPT